MNPTTNHDFVQAAEVSPPISPGEKKRLRARMEAILRYDGLGLPAFPVRARTKRPRFKGWQRKATDDGLRLYRLFSESPGENVGLIMGREVWSGEFTFTLDVDPRNGGKESLRRL